MIDASNEFREMTNEDRAEMEAGIEADEKINSFLWDVVETLEARGFTPAQISGGLLFMASQEAQCVGRNPAEWAEQVRYFRVMADHMSSEAAMLEKMFGGIGETGSDLVDAVTAGSA